MNLSAHIAEQERRVNRWPTEPQQRAGNYAKGHVKIHGLDISIENPRGSIREGRDPDGKPWKVRMPVPYGYIRGSMGADNSQVDVFIGPQLDALMGNATESPDSYRGRLHRLAADTLEILDGLDGDSDLEPSFGYFDGCRPGVDECEPPDDAEPDLGAFDRMINQERSWKTVERNVDHYGWSTSQELDDSDHEPSLGGSMDVDQTHWSDGNFTDREGDALEAG